MEYNIRV